MNRLLTTATLASLILLPALAQADPVTGTFTSTDLGGQILTGRASTWRSGVNSGLPHVLHAQSWDGVTLGTQWDISCATENSAFSMVDNRVAGNGTVVYTSTFNGGTFNFYAGAWPWGDGTGTLNTTTLISTVQHIMIGNVSTPVASVVNGSTSGEFTNGCLLSFAIGNGAGVGETPFASIPATYPVFLDGSCGPASAGAQYGTWGNVVTLTMHVNCTVPSEQATWGAVKGLYR
ncbi:MAG: hypothetical protein IPP62_16375 [bacterium]|nr:hypothetical protein [bacterium]